ncbi:MAG: hypothetical protein V4496_06855 [Pseudomonadota bacterium]
MLRSISQVGANIQYNTEMRLYDIQLDSQEGRLLLTGCTGGEIDPKVIWDLFKTGDSGAELNTRAQVAAGMRLVKEADLTTDTLVELLGDQIYPDGVAKKAAKATLMLKKEVFNIYSPINAATFLMNGNHEVGGHGKKQKTQEHLDEKSQRQVNAVNRDKPANFYMPANYYAQIIRNNQGEVLACVVCADTNSFWYDTDQQNWLMQTIIPEFMQSSPEAPWLWLGHHAFMDTIGKRGLKGDGGKYSADKKWHNASLHQINFMTAQKIGLDLKRFKIFAAHEHTNYVAINDASSNVPDQFIFGGGGSMSNSLEQVALPMGTKWSACTFGFGEVILTTKGMSVSFTDCTDIKLKSPDKNQLKTLFSVEIPRHSHRLDITKNSGLDPILQKAFKKQFKLLDADAQEGSSSLALRIVCFIWSHAYQQLNNLTHELNLIVQEKNPLVTLLLLPFLTEPTAIQPASLLKTVEQCLLLFATPINQKFLGVKPYKKLFLTLEACHYCLAAMLSPERMAALAVASSVPDSEEISESERPTFDRSIRHFIKTNYSNLQGDDSDDEDENNLAESDDEQDNKTDVPVAPQEVTLLVKKSLSSGEIVGSERLERILKDFLETFVNNSRLLRLMISSATSQRLNYLYNTYQTEHKKSLDAKYQLYFVAGEEAEIALAYMVDFLVNKLSPVILIQAIIKTDRHINTGLSGMIFLQLANAFVRMLENESKQGAYVDEVKAIFLCWNSKHADTYDEQDQHKRLSQRAQEFLCDYFSTLAQNSNVHVYAKFLHKECLEALWSEENIWQPEMRKHFEITEDKIAAYRLWQARPEPTYVQKLLCYLGSFFPGHDTKESVSAPVDNPILSKSTSVNSTRL